MGFGKGKKKSGGIWLLGSRVPITRFTGAVKQNQKYSLLGQSCPWISQ